MSAVISLPTGAGDALYRTAPHNIAAEQGLLGAILVNNGAFDRVQDFLLPEHFFEDVHRRIFDVSAQLIRQDKPATPVTLRTFLGDEDLGGVTVSQYLARLASEATTIVNAGHYGRIVYDLALRRRIIDIGDEMVNLAYESPVDQSPRDQIEEVERKLYGLAEAGKYGGGFGRFADAARLSIDMAANAIGRKGGLSGLATGLTDLDRQMGGLQKSDLVILAGRPAMGKTSLATNIAFNVARAYRAEVDAQGQRKTVDGGVVGFFSLEMSSEQLATRILSEQASISSSDIRRGKIDNDQFDRLVDTMREIERLPLFIDQTGGISIGQLAARARRLKRQHGLDFLVIDYLQLLSGSSKKGENRVQELTEITTGLKALAKELEVPIMALSQLSRQVESRDDKRPQLSDLRESGSIEQDADVVLFVYRDEYYLGLKEPKAGTEEHAKWQTDMEAAHGRAEVIVSKQRHGPVGTVQLQFENRFTRFSNLAETDRLPERTR